MEELKELVRKEIEILQAIQMRQLETSRQQAETIHLIGEVAKENAKRIRDFERLFYFTIGLLAVIKIVYDILSGAAS